MNTNRMRTKLTLVGLMLSALFFLGFFFLLDSRASSPTPPVEAVADSPATIPWILITNLVLVVGIGIFVALRTYGQGQKRKHKRGDEQEADDYLREMVEDGAIQLADDGELPEFYDEDVFGDEKPKRSEEGW